MEKLRIGIVGTGRGHAMMKYCKTADNAEIVAICDYWEPGLKRIEKELNDDRITYYLDYEEFLKHDMDVVMLANFATEHAPFAIKALEAGKNVISEVVTAQTLSQAARLIDAVEKTGKRYVYAENYCYSPAVRELKRLYQSGELGTLEYMEGEYIHNCENAWDGLTRGDRNHWRNITPATFYCTHSFGPIRHITGMRPISVVGFEQPRNTRAERMGRLGAASAIEMVTLENGVTVRSLHGNLCCGGTWYQIYGSKGHAQLVRGFGSSGYIRARLDSEEGACDNTETVYVPKPDEIAKKGRNSAHGGGDYGILYNAIEYIKGDDSMDVIDVYEAYDMWSIGFFAHLSALNGNQPEEIPDFRDPEVRKQYYNDNRCTDPKVAGDQLLPTCPGGTPDVPESTYDRIKEIYRQKHPAQDGIY